MAIKSKKSKAKLQGRHFTVYLTEREATLIKEAAELRHRGKISSYIASVVVPQAEKDAKEGR